MSDAFPTCPVPCGARDVILLAHGGGGRVMRNLLEQVFLPAFDNPMLAERHDSAVVELGGARVAFTTDGYVVRPAFFPGGDIGTLAVCGTVNDLAMAGARPMFLSAGFILEEGFSLADLQRIASSMRDAARGAEVALVTGDTKVVDRGKGDGVFVHTAGLGLVPPGVDIRPKRVAPGDAVIVSGDLGRHGIAVLSVREGLAFGTTIVSDCAPLSGAVEALLASGVDVHCMRDLTRGGLASALNEIAMDAGVGLAIEERDVPVIGPVSAACELLGLDPLYVANEGRFVAFVPAEDAERALSAMRGHPASRGAAIIGRVTEADPGTVVLRSGFGGTRLLDLLSGEQLPRIC